MPLRVPTAFALAAALFAHAFAPAAAPPPRLEDHPAAEIYREPPAPLDVLNTRNWRAQRSLLRKAAADGPNFAGAYTIASFACGHRCQQIVVLDARTGKTVGDLQTRTGARYRLDSTLLIANPPESIAAGDTKTATKYYVWREGAFSVLD